MSVKYIYAHSEYALYKLTRRHENYGHNEFFTLPLFHAGLQEPEYIYDRDFELQN